MNVDRKHCLVYLLPLPHEGSDLWPVVQPDVVRVEVPVERVLPPLLLLEEYV